MRIRKGLFSGALIAGLTVGGVTIAYNQERHPNLVEAQRLIERALEKVSAAQEANEFDMDGHAAKAKELLGQAREQIKMAAHAANHHER